MPTIKPLPFCRDYWQADDHKIPKDALPLLDQMLHRDDATDRQVRKIARHGLAYGFGTREMQSKDLVARP